MKNQKNSLEGVPLVAMKNGKPVEDQAEAGTALLRPVIAAVLKHAGADLDAPAPAVLKTTADRNGRISDLEIECATLMHGLRLADRRYEDAFAIQLASGQVSAESDAGELRRAVRQITAMMANREWAEHVSRDPDASALESALTPLIGELAAALDDSGYASMPAKQEPKRTEVRDSGRAALQPDLWRQDSGQRASVRLPRQGQKSRGRPALLCRGL